MGLKESADDGDRGDTEVGCWDLNGDCDDGVWAKG